MQGNDLDYSKTMAEAKSQSNADTVGELYGHSCTSADIVRFSFTLD